ncbi:MAG: DUF2283 domain-containing protein [Nitrosopumilaceae archaeon]|nr:DUF2283 domain-containing protein [Nitrosopumilaceae archaeon]NIU88876.1 DUF2283 domain-containing protein [Nitrosopumilaceae archaeon]NIV66996.1 DUF2283 domain-containing protein [Nitrosopumilaceae archaeon]NIX62528.1 DUF2283 domain-containing protein [Nitrosopumilaceae archaeon]
MKIEYDPKHDVLNIEFLSGEAIEESIEIDGIIIDYSDKKKIVSIEILDAGKKTSKDPLDFLDLKIVKEQTKRIKESA